MSEDNEKKQDSINFGLLDDLKDMKNNPVVFKLLMEEAKKRGICTNLNKKAKTNSTTPTFEHYYYNQYIKKDNYRNYKNQVRRISKIKYVPFNESKEKTYEERFEEYYRQYLEEDQSKNNNNKDRYINLTALDEPKDSKFSTQINFDASKHLNHKSIKIRKKIKNKSNVSPDTEFKRNTAFNFMTPKVNLGKSISHDPSFPIVNQLLNSESKHAASVKRRKSRFNQAFANKSSIDMDAAAVKNITLPNLKPQKDPKLGHPKIRHSSIAVAKKVGNDYTSQQFFIDSKILHVANDSQSITNKKNISMNVEIAKTKDNLTDRSLMEESKTNVGSKFVTLPKVSPFAKSIPIKKYPVKLFSEDDEYLCN